MKKIFIGGLALALLGLLTVEVLAQGLVEPIFACVNSNDGTVRIIDPSNTSCKKNETLISWPRVDTNTDTLGGLVCAAGQVPLRDASGAWVCGTIAPDQDTLASLHCTSGQTVKWDGTAWVCYPPARFVDNGDGTISDTKTGLMWEKKLAADGTQGGNCLDANQANRSIHCVNNTYRWSSNGIDPNGELFTDFLDEINKELSKSNDGSTVDVAGYHDWIIPNIAQLQTILLDPCPGGGVPCIDPIFGPTQANNYWSSTNHPLPGSLNAWVVYFHFGWISGNGKDAAEWARAVRVGR